MEVWVDVAVGRPMDWRIGFEEAIDLPFGRENAKNIYFGLIMGVSAALPTCLHIGLFFYSATQQIIPSRKQIASTAEKSPKQE